MIGIAHIVVAYPNHFEIHEVCPWTLALAKADPKADAKIRAAVAGWPEPEHIVHDRAAVDAILAQGDTHYEYTETAMN